MPCFSLRSFSFRFPLRVPSPDSLAHENIFDYLLISIEYRTDNDEQESNRNLLITIKFILLVILYNEQGKGDQ